MVWLFAFCRQNPFFFERNILSAHSIALSPLIRIILIPAALKPVAIAAIVSASILFLFPFFLNLSILYPRFTDTLFTTLNTFCRTGARPAEPGEFTKRAFLNGRLDLSQAEAVIDIINSKSEMALKNSVNQLRGRIYEKISEMRKKILQRTAFIEAALDDPEHISLDGFSEELLEDIILLLDQLEKLIYSCDNGRMLREGIKTVILGNMHSSSL